MSTTNHAAPDGTGPAIRAISQAIYLDGDVISHGTARLIAAAIHPGAGSHLQHLASSGQFDRAVLIHEVEHLVVQPFHEPWRSALLEYLRAPRSIHPWARSASVRRDGHRRSGP